MHLYHKRCRKQMSNLFIELYQVNKSANYRMDDPKFEETKFSKIGKLYRALEKEYGRCSSKILIDGLNANSRQVGWVFEKREYYSDCVVGKPINYLNKKDRDLLTFICATYVTVHTDLPIKTVKYNFAKF